MRNLNQGLNLEKLEYIKKKLGRDTNYFIFLDAVGLLNKYTFI